MKKLLLILFIIPNILLGQNTKRFAYVAPGIFLGQNSNNLFMPAVGVGFRNKNTSVGASLYYTQKFSLSANLDLRLIGTSKKNTDPFFTIQPGVSFYRKEVNGSVTKGGFDLKAGIGIMSNKKNGLYLSTGYSRFALKTTYNGSSNNGSLWGFYLLGGLKF